MRGVSLRSMVQSCVFIVCFLGLTLARCDDPALLYNGSISIEH